MGTSLSQLIGPARSPWAEEVRCKSWTRKSKIWSVRSTAACSFTKLQMRLEASPLIVTGPSAKDIVQRHVPSCSCSLVMREPNLKWRINSFSLLSGVHVGASLACHAFFLTMTFFNKFLVFYSGQLDHFS